MSFRALCRLMIDRPQPQVALGGPEGVLRLGELDVELPQLFRICSRPVRPQQVTAARRERPFGAGFVLIYLPAIELEEQHLGSLFPEFSGYKERVPALWPTIHPLQSGGAFRWTLYARNREYQALLGFLAGVALLVAKVLVPAIP
jgi:hypothetical protein